MFRGNWLKQPKVRLTLGLLLAVLLCAGWLAYGLLESAQYERESAAKADNYSRYTGDKVAEACVGISVLERVKCLQEAEVKKADYEYNQADLVAQRQSALWAYIMAAAAAIGVCLSAIGVGLVWTTFRETKDANVIARNAMIGQLRPWIKISAKQMGQIRVNEDELSLKIQCKFENKGESPAINFCYHTTMYFEDMTSKQLASDIKGWFNEESNSFDEVNIFRNDDEVRDCEVEHSGRVTGEFSVNLVVAARYQSAFSPEYHYTAIMLRIVNVSSGRFLFATLGPNHTSLHRIELRPRENFAGIAT